MTNSLRLTTLALAALLLSGAAAFAQTAPAKMDPRWTPWLGCWRQADSSVVPAAAGITPSPLTVCVKPAPNSAGVVMTSISDGRVVIEQTIVADGIAHPINDAGCEGTQKSEWSRTGTRLFTDVDASCNGQPKQRASGVTMFTKGGVWVDAQATTVDSESQVRLRHYQRTADIPAAATGLPSSDVLARAAMASFEAGSHTLTFEDVIEASAKIASPAVEAAIVESGSKFGLSSKSLTQLADNGVTSHVIDLMVAQSYPERFRVDRQQTWAPMPPSISSIAVPPAIVGYPYGMGYFYDPFYYYGYYYSPFAYSGYWGSPYYYNGGRSVVVINGGASTVGGGGGAGTAISTPSQHGQMVNGRGYTNVSPATPEEVNGPASHTASNPQGVRSTGSSDSSSSSSSSSSNSGSSNSSGGGMSNSGGYSGGGSDSGRTAQPR